MTKNTNTNTAELNTIDLEVLSQVSGGAKSGKDPRDPKGFTKHYHPFVVVVVKNGYRRR